MAHTIIPLPHSVITGSARSVMLAWTYYTGPRSHPLARKRDAGATSFWYLWPMTPGSANGLDDDSYMAPTKEESHQHTRREWQWTRVE